MPITVQHGKDESTTHQGSEKWHIDEDGRLHIVGSNGNLASYNEGYWANVQNAAQDKTRTTAVATLYIKEAKNDGQTFLGFNADYNDERNKGWAKYTPGLGLQMTVLDSVAEKFEQGTTYLLTLEKQD